jgi:hypothetical protein
LRACGVATFYSFATPISVQPDTASDIIHNWTQKDAALHQTDVDQSCSAKLLLYPSKGLFLPQKS